MLGTSWDMAALGPAHPSSSPTPWSPRGGSWHQALTAALGHPGCLARAAAPFPAPARGNGSIRKSSSPSPEHRQVTGQVKAHLGLRTHPGSLLGEHGKGILQFSPWPGLCRIKDMKVQDWLWPAQIPGVGELQDTTREDLCAWRGKVNSQLSRTQQHPTDWGTSSVCQNKM